MKKKLILIILAIFIPLLLLSSCGDHEHEFEISEKLDWYHVYECGCGEIKNEDHIFDVKKVIEEATASKPGKYKVECIICGFKTTIEKELAHVCSFSKVFVSNSSTHWYECTCGRKTNEAPHTFSEWVTTQKPTEYLTGIKERECTTCKYIESTYIDTIKHEHTFGKWQVESLPTKTEEGLVARKCVSNYCNHYKEEKKIPAVTVENLTSKYNVVIIKTPTCKEAGVNQCTYFINEQAITFEINVSAIDHVFDLYEFIDNQNHFSICYCGSRVKEEHDVVEWEETLKATCNSKGQKKGYCTKCNALAIVDTDKLEHHEIELPAKKPTCTEPGNEKGTYCDNCGEVATGGKEIPVIDCNFKDGKCTMCQEIQKISVNYYSDGELVETASFDYGSNFSGYELGDDINFVEGWYSKDGKTKYDNTYVLKSNLDVYANWVKTIEISTKDDFYIIKDFPSYRYVLINDISFNGEVLENICDFSGELIGNGYSLSGFIMSSKAVSGNYGIFKSNSGIIKNITLKDFTFNITISNKSSCSGILVGNNTGTIQNVNIEGSVSTITSTLAYTESMKHGGIAGNNSGNINNCNVSFTSTISLNYNQPVTDQGKYYTKYYIGGIVGCNSSIVEYCNATSSTNITSDVILYASGYKKTRPYNNNYIGGLVGLNTGENAIISKCYANSEYKYSYSEVAYDGKYSYAIDNEVESLYLGGLLGCNDSKAILELSSATTKITGNTKWSNYIGGLVGANNNVAYVKSSYADADIYTNASNHHKINIGGFIGYNSANILNCYSVGDVKTSRNSSIGGFVGGNGSSGSILKSYTTVNVIGSSGYAGKFAGYSDGVTNKNYETTKANLVLNNADEAKLNQTSIITTMDYNDIINPKFLKETMTWDSEGWYIDGAIDPILLWELDKIHNFEEIKKFEATCESHGYTLSHCSHCDRIIMTDIVKATGHAHDESDKGIIIKPTCDEQGYTKYTCITCEKEYRLDYVDALGHEKITEIDCNNPNLYYEDGKFLYYCQSINQNDITKCNDIIEIDLSLINHTDVINISYLAPACGSLDEKTGELEGEVIGHSSGRYCSSSNCAYFTAEDKNYVIKESVEIIPHEYNVEYTKKPTCIETGLANHKCKLCGKVVEDVIVDIVSHTYVSGNLRCTVCNQFEFDLSQYEPINDYDDLVNMNLDGKYYLAADIDLANISFKPIGSATKPFTGHLIGLDKEGKTHTIKNLTLAQDGKNDIYIGLFAKIGNDGVVANVTLENLSISVYNCKNAIIGGITGSNIGTIYKCEVKGITSIRLETNVLADINTNITEDFKYTFGNIAGENIGKVNECNISGMITMSYIISSNVTGSFDVINTITSFGFATNNTTVISGGIVGLNRGILSNSTNEAKYTSDNNFNSNVGGINKGQSYLYVNLYDGALVGINEKEVLKCKSVVKTNNIHSSDKEYYEVKDLVEVVVVQRLEYMKITDYTVFEKYAGIIGYSSKNSSFDVEIKK